ncbi:ATP-binding protein [Frateuria edaphi]|uniref:hybrid sensor histidine kinase/response regulator n=1 Tax=Frateuria edaphi TaxID=2898793 RepID=UPI001E2A8399|nr:hybrid sensor histidine kinase/response regulator [Frateuria edaphi]UGB47353.1 ATP-binding protein [Frateuria edaphi]
MIPHLSERILILAPRGRDAQVAGAILAEAGLRWLSCASLKTLVEGMAAGAGTALVTEESLLEGDLHALSAWLEAQPQWSDFPFILVTSRGGIERNPAAGRLLTVLGNVTFLERPFHPTTLVSLAQAALRGRRRQYEARERLTALYESEQRFRAAIQAVQGVLWTTNAQGEMVGDQPGWSALTGQTLVDYVGNGWAAALHPDDVHPTLGAWAAAVAEKRAYRCEQRVRVRNGDWRTFSVRAIPTFDREGVIHEWVGVHTDVTEQRATEHSLRELTATLEQRVREETAARQEALVKLHEAQKLETIGQLTGGVAHDFNNLLMPITGALDLLQRRFADADARAGRLIDGALQSAERAKTLVQRLLGFARRQTLQTQAVDLERLLEGMHDLIRSSVGSTIELHTVCPSHLPQAVADPNQLELALLNLCVNARDAMPKGGTLTIAADVVAPGPEQSELPQREYVRVSVTDTGTGMDQQTLARAIEPFFSTKETGRGTGLGLSMVHGLAGQLGGHFAISSTPGKGTRVELWLPKASGATASIRRETQPERLRTPTRALNVLLVDDEQLVRDGTAAMLRELGHRVVEVGGAGEALEKLQDGLQIDVVVTDYKMPRMDGAELARRLRRVQPALPVLLITGYSGHADDTRGLSRLAKPFRQADIAAALEELMPSASAAITVGTLEG